MDKSRRRVGGDGWRRGAGFVFVGVVVGLVWAPAAGAQSGDERREGGAEAAARWESPFEVERRGRVTPRSPRRVIALPVTRAQLAAVVDSGQVVAVVAGEEVEEGGEGGEGRAGGEGEAGEAGEAGTANAADEEAADIEEAGASSPGRRVHRVGAGDTLFGLARRYGVSAAAIREANDMRDDVVRLGETLIIPGQEEDQR